MARENPPCGSELYLQKCRDGKGPMSEVLLIVAATVQLRMYTSPLFSQYSDVFVEEPEDGDLRHRSFKTH